MQEISKELVIAQLPKKQQDMVNDETIEEINKLAQDPDYGPEFLNAYMDHINLLRDRPGVGHVQYLSAVKFFSLVEAGNSLTQAYIKTFPERYEKRKQNNPQSAHDAIRGEASRFNNTMLVNEIRKIAAIPVQLIHRNILHEAILTQAELMRTARSEMVRQKAASSLITELKPQEDTVLKVDVNDGAKSIIEELRQATEKLAAAEHQAVMAGVPVKNIAEGNIVEADYEDLSNE